MDAEAEAYRPRGGRADDAGRADHARLSQGGADRWDPPARVRHGASPPAAESRRPQRRQDVCLVPLENTFFNNSKSNIKFIESGIHGVPIIASPVDQFKRAISHSINGWLCGNPSEWYDQLVSLVDSKKQLISVSLMAYKTSLESYTF